MNYRKKIAFGFFLAVFLLLLSSCPQILANNASQTDLYYITGSKENREHFNELFNLLKMEEKGSEGELAVAREIASSYARLKDYDRLIHFLSARTINNPDDPYNGYYLLMIAYAYIQQNSQPIAALYFDLIIKNYPDLEINGESIHLVCLTQLININKASEKSQNAERQVWYYQELISKFPDNIDLGAAYFSLGQACEKTGDWNGAIAAYTNYLPYAGSIITGFPNAEQYAREQVDFSKSNKDWTFDSLPSLRNAVQTALDNDNPWALNRYMSKVNFFTRSWGQTETDDTGIDITYNLAEFMYNNHIRYDASLDASTNATEAYLRTTGWSRYLPTWYLYFRKIYFPQDPEIHGRWEWAGIYYGEKF